MSDVTTETHMEYMRRYLERLYGMPSAAMADTEAPDARDRCVWDPARNTPTSKPCGSEENLFKVTRRAWNGQPLEQNVCGRHINEAWTKKSFGLDTAEKRPLPTRTTG